MGKYIIKYCKTFQMEFSLKWKSVQIEILHQFLFIHWVTQRAISEYVLCLKNTRRKFNICKN